MDAEAIVVCMRDAVDVNLSPVTTTSSHKTNDAASIRCIVAPPPT